MVAERAYLQLRLACTPCASKRGDDAHTNAPREDSTSMCDSRPFIASCEQGQHVSARKGRQTHSQSRACHGKRTLGDAHAVRATQ